MVARAGILVRSISKAEPLKVEGCSRLDCFPRAILEEGTVKRTDQVITDNIRLDVRPATWMEYQVYMRENLVVMNT